MWKLLMVGVVMAQAVPSPAPDEYVGLGVSLEARFNAYSGVNHIRTVYVGEPVELRTSLYNNTTKPLALGGLDRIWDEGLSIARRDGVGRPPIVRARVRGPAPQALNLAPGQSTFAVWRLSQSSGEPLDPGVYQLAVSVNPNSLNRLGLGDRLSETINFEVKTPVTVGEQIDYALHMAYRAMLNNDETEVEQYARMALRLDSESVQAHVDLGAMWKRRSDCSGMRREYDTAAAILENGGDKLLLLDGGGRRELAANLRAAIAACR